MFNFPNKISPSLRQLLIAVFTDVIVLTLIGISLLVLAEVVFPGFMEGIVPLTPIIWLLAVFLAILGLLQTDNCRRKNSVKFIKNTKPYSVIIITGIVVLVSRNFPLPAIIAIVAGTAAIILLLLTEATQIKDLKNTK